MPNNRNTKSHPADASNTQSADDDKTSQKSGKAPIFFARFSFLNNSTAVLKSFIGFAVIMTVVIFAQMITMEMVAMPSNSQTVAEQTSKPSAPQPQESVTKSSDAQDAASEPKPIIVAAATQAEETPANTDIRVYSPATRPKSAPKIDEFPKGNDWYDRSLTGLQPPYPSSFKFLDSQGPWYTPFNRPGMPGRYDLRGFHQPKN